MKTNAATRTRVNMGSCICSGSATIQANIRQSQSKQESSPLATHCDRLRVSISWHVPSQKWTQMPGVGTDDESCADHSRWLPALLRKVRRPVKRDAAAAPAHLSGSSSPRWPIVSKLCLGSPLDHGAVQTAAASTPRTKITCDACAQHRCVPQACALAKEIFRRICPLPTRPSTFARPAHVLCSLQWPSNQSRGHISPKSARQMRHMVTAAMATLLGTGAAQPRPETARLMCWYRRKLETTHHISQDPKIACISRM